MYNKIVDELSKRFDAMVEDFEDLFEEPHEKIQGNNKTINLKM